MCNNLSIFSFLCSVKNHFLCHAGPHSHPLVWFPKKELLQRNVLSKRTITISSLLFFFREQKVRARRNNKEMLKHEIQFMSSYHNVSRVKTSKVAEGENYRSFCQAQVQVQVPGQVQVRSQVRSKRSKD